MRGDLGRARGVWISIDEVPAHLACGWSIADLETAFRREDVVLMRPPERLEAEAA